MASQSERIARGIALQAKLAVIFNMPSVSVTVEGDDVTPDVTIGGNL